MKKDENKAPFDLRERILLFSKRVHGVCGKLPPTPECSRLRSQLGAASSSIGANYAEADGTFSRKDLLHKLILARKEALETKYFLRLIDGTHLKNGSVQKEIDEAEAIVLILSRMIQKTSNKK